MNQRMCLQRRDECRHCDCAEGIKTNEPNSLGDVRHTANKEKNEGKSGQLQDMGMRNAAVVSVYEGKGKAGPQ
jgi:hypothetical protein